MLWRNHNKYNIISKPDLINFNFERFVFKLKWIHFSNSYSLVQVLPTDLANNHLWLPKYVSLELFLDESRTLVWVLASLLILRQSLLNIEIIYRTRAILTRSRFEAALVYKPRILSLKKVSSNTSRSAA